MEIRYGFFLGCFVAYVAIRHIFEKRIAERAAGGEAGRDQTVERRVDGAEKILLGVVMIASLLLPLLQVFSPWFSFADYTQPPWLTVIGGGALLLALWVFWISHSRLGENWSRTLELRSGHQLVTEGIYSRIRHPMYSGIFLFSIGQGLILQNGVAGWGALVAFTALYVVRVPKEEAMMIDAFGDEYRNYMARTGRLLPGGRRT